MIHEYTDTMKRTPINTLTSTLRWMAVIILIVGIQHIAHAAGTVNNCTEADLRTALNGGGTVDFACDGTITLADTLTISSNTSIDATGHSITISGGNAVRVLYVNPDVTLSLKSLTVANGEAESGGGLYNEQGTVNIENSTFTGNQAMGAAGSAGADAITGNGGDGGAGGEARGAGLYNYQGVVNIHNSRFANNSARGGNGGKGGIGGEGSLVSGGVGGVGAAASGGGIYNVGTLSMTNSTFEGNSATGGTGGTGGKGNDSAYFSHGGYGGNGGMAYGGGIYSQNWMAITNSTFANNSSEAGTGGRSGDAGGSSRVGGTAGSSGLGGEAFGGAVSYISFSSSHDTDALTVSNSTFYGNKTIGGNAGEVGQSVDSSLNSGVSGSWGSSGGHGGRAWGGAIFGLSGSLGSITASNCTFVSNQVIGGNGADGGDGANADPNCGICIGGEGGQGGGAGDARGGGIAGGSNCTVINSTFSVNVAVPGTPGQGGSGGAGHGGNASKGSDGWLSTRSGGGAVVANSSITLRNSILVGKAAGGNCLRDANSNIGDDGGNISDDNSAAFDTAATSSLNDTDPKLELAPDGKPLLKDNGGPTPTIALLAGSPAINAGNDTFAPSTDQRGVARVETSDIGAYEFVPPVFSWSVLDVAVGSDGQSRVLWEKNTGEIMLWTVNAAGTITTQRNYGPFAGWRATAIAANTTPGADNGTRILWQHSSGAIGLWSVDAVGAVNSSPTYGPYAGWDALNIAVGGDNQTRILWQNSNGSVGLWTLSAVTGSAVVSYSPIYGPFAGWSVADVAVSSDNTTHLLWRQSNGAVGLWSINTAGTVSYSPVFGPYAGWSALGVDVGGDNKARLLWQHSSGQMGLWSVDSAGGVSYSPVYGPYAGWSASGIAVSSDNGSRVLWRNDDGAMSLWTLDAAGAVVTTSAYGPY
jgi:hypothetical protein